MTAFDLGSLVMFIMDALTSKYLQSLGSEHGKVDITQKDVIHSVEKSHIVVEHYQETVNCENYTTS